MSNSRLHSKFEAKIDDYLKKEEENIKKYFNDFSDGTPCKPIKKRIKGKDFLLEIYNIPAFFDLENGILHLLTELQVLFKIFFEKNKNLKEEQKKEKYLSFINSITNEDIIKIYELSGVNYTKEKSYKIKKSLDLIISYFDLESIKYYFSKKEKLLGYTGLGIGSVSLTVLAVYFAGINLPILLIIGGAGVIFTTAIAGYLFYKYRDNNKKNEKNEKEYQNNLKEKINFIEGFFQKINSCLAQNYDSNNLFIIGIDKSKKNYGDFIMKYHEINGISSIENPRVIENTGETKADYYCCYLDGMHYYISKYEKIIESKDKINIEELNRNLLNDFQQLSAKKTYKELYEYIAKEKLKFDLPHPNNESLDTSMDSIKQKD